MSELEHLIEIEMDRMVMNTLFDYELPVDKYRMRVTDMISYARNYLEKEDIDIYNKIYFNSITYG